MYPINKELQRAIDQLYNELKERDYGDKFSWKELSNLAGLRPNTTKDVVYYVANKVCLMLMTHEQKYLETVFGFGKRIIMPEEHGLVAKKTAKKSVKIYRKAGAVIASTNIDKLTNEQKKRIIEQANKYSTLEMFATEMLKKKRISQASKGDVRNASLFLDTIKLFTEKN